MLRQRLGASFVDNPARWHLYRIADGIRGPLVVHLANIAEGADYDLFLMDAQGNPIDASVHYQNAGERIVRLAAAATEGLYAMVVNQNRSDRRPAYTN